MAKTAMKIKQQRPAKFSTREYNRCKICGRPHAYLRKYGICRICFRELAYKGQIPGVKKASLSLIHIFAMDFWASLEHQIKYKKEIPGHKAIIRDLKACADIIAETDKKMQDLRHRIDYGTDDLQEVEK